MRRLLRPIDLREMEAVYKRISPVLEPVERAIDERAVTMADALIIASILIEKICETTGSPASHVLNDLCSMVDATTAKAVTPRIKVLS